MEKKGILNFLKSKKKKENKKQKTLFWQARLS